MAIRFWSGFSRRQCIQFHPSVKFPTLQRGVYRGKKKALSEAARQQLQQRLAAGASKAQIAREFGISRETLYQYVKMMAE